MYLTLLDEKEKESFLGLAYNLAAADGNYSDEEKAMIRSYCQEMQFEFDDTKMVKETSELLNAINSGSNTKIKKIIIFELIGLAMADGGYDKDEKELINLAEKQFGIEEGFAKKCEDGLIKYIEFQTALNQIVLG